MAINMGAELLQHIGQGGHVSLDGSGQLQQQSGISKFFQGIADAFRGLTAAGRAGIAERNARLEEAMADLIRRDELLPNLTAGPLPPAGEGARVSINKALANMFTDQILRETGQPETMRATTQKIVQEALTANPALAGGNDPKALKDFVHRTVTQLMSDPQLRAAMNQGYSKGPEGVEPVLEFMRTDLTETFLAPGQQREINPETGVHKAFLADSNRTAPTINGVQLGPGRTMEQCGQQLMEAVPLPARPIVSLLASQAGLNGSLLMLVVNGLGDGTYLNSEQPTGEPFPMDKLHYGGQGTEYTITTHPDRVEVQVHFQTKGVLQPGHSPTGDGINFPGDDFTVTVSVPLDQFPLEPGTAPHIRVHDFTRRPVTEPMP